MDKNKKFRLARIITALVIAALLGVSLLFTDRIDAALGYKKNFDYIEGELKVHFVDVGQGDSCIIELPDDKKMIIDGGDTYAAEGLLNYIDTNIFDGKEGRFDYAILTHSDADHCGSLDDVLNKYPTKVFYRPNQLATYKGYSDPCKDSLKGDYGSVSTLVYRNAIASGCTAEKVIVTDASDETQNVIKSENLSETDDGYYEINFYTPTADFYKKDNDYSPIMVLEYLGKKIALSGDAELAAESEFVELCNRGEGRYSVFDDGFSVDVIKLGHHGSDTSSSEAYLETMTTALSRPSVRVIISCGADNKYGHPHKSTLSKLSDMGFSSENVLRTDLMGSILITVKAENGRAVLMVGDTEAATGRSWKEYAIILIAADIFILIILPELVVVTVKKKKRRR